MEEKGWEETRRQGRKETDKPKPSGRKEKKREGAVPRGTNKMKWQIKSKKK